MVTMNPRETIKEIILDGTPICVYMKENYLITIDGIGIYLPWRLYKVAAIITMRRIMEDPWVSSGELSNHQLNRRYLFSLRKAVKFRIRRSLERKEPTRRYLLKWDFYEMGLPSENPHSYRLAVDPRQTRISVGPDLAKFEDDAVQVELNRFEMMTHTVKERV